MNSNYIEHFDKYNYIVTDRISKICPEYLNDSDFIQDIYVEVIDYIKNNEAYNNVSDHMKVGYIHSKTTHIIESLLKNRNKENICNDYDNVLIDIDFENRITDGLSKEIIFNILKTLTPREERVLKLHFGLEDNNPMTLTEIGNKLNISKSRVRQIEAKALGKLRHPNRLKYVQGFYGYMK